MIIRPDSPLRLLPAGLDRAQMLFFDAIRVGIDMAEQAYTRLSSKLDHIATATQTDDEWDGLVSVCFLDAWSIVDALHRLRALLRRFPGLKQRTSYLQVFLRSTAGVKDLRDSIQHIDEKIDQLARSDKSVWGSLTWFVEVERREKAFKVGSFCAGTQFGEMHDLPNPAGFTMSARVDHIFLNAAGYEISLSALIKAVSKFVPEFEKQVAPNFKGHTSAIADFIMIADMTVLPNSEFRASDASRRDDSVTSVSRIAIRCRPPVQGAPSAAGDGSLAGEAALSTDVTEKVLNGQPRHSEVRRENGEIG